MKTSKLTVHKGNSAACVDVLKSKRTLDAIGSSVKPQKLHDAIAQNITDCSGFWNGPIGF